MAARQRNYEDDRITRKEFTEFQKESKSDFTDIRRGVTEEINIAYERYDKTIERYDKTMERLERTISGIEDRMTKAQERSEARLAADREASEARLANDRYEFMQRFVEERKEWRTTKRWLYLNFGGVIALIITVAIAIIGFIVTNGNNQI